jgi:hypothetical protein
MSKTVKLLADGTIAKVGMIVIYDNYDNNQLAKITAIRNGYKSINTYDLLTTPLINFWHINNAKNSYYMSLSKLRKATPEERKQYYKQLYSNQNE